MPPASHDTTDSPVFVNWNSSPLTKAAWVFAFERRTQSNPQYQQYVLFGVDYIKTTQWRRERAGRRHFFVRELVEDKILEVPFVRTADNIADFFTKWFNANDFVALRDYIMNVP